MGKETKYFNRKARSYEAQRAWQDLKNVGFLFVMSAVIGIVLLWLRQHQ